MNTFAHTISPSAIAAMDAVRGKSTAQHMVLEGMKDLAVLEAPDPKPRHHLNGGPGRVGGAFNARPAPGGHSPPYPFPWTSGWCVMPLRNWPVPT